MNEKIVLGKVVIAIIDGMPKYAYITHQTDQQKSIRLEPAG
ncbi:hypothetical protein [Buttiauxella sp. 3AFRM03]|nr:hypothetical protein [Buttiauxella sp. 3AFRM03]